MLRTNQWYACLYSLDFYAESKYGNENLNFQNFLESGKTLTSRLNVTSTWGMLDCVNSLSTISTSSARILREPHHLSMIQRNAHMLKLQTCRYYNSCLFSSPWSLSKFRFLHISHNASWFGRGPIFGTFNSFALYIGKRANLRHAPGILTSFKVYYVICAMWPSLWNIFFCYLCIQYATNGIFFWTLNVNLHLLQLGKYAICSNLHLLPANVHSKTPIPSVTY